MSAATCEEGLVVANNNTEDHNRNVTDWICLKPFVACCGLSGGKMPSFVVLSLLFQINPSAQDMFDFATQEGAIHQSCSSL